MDFTYILPPLLVLAAYLIGSLSFAVIISRLLGLPDPRTFGSKNPGATNVLRSGSRAAAIVVLLLDAVKGWLPVFWVVRYGPDHGLADGTLALVALAAFMGHVYPVFFGFKGGKGVATALGVLLGISVWLGLLALLIWILVALLFRYSSLASIAAALLAPGAYLLLDGVFGVKSAGITFSLLAIGLLLLYRHLDNINRLAAGTESKLGAKAAAASVHGIKAESLSSPRQERHHSSKHKHHR